MAENVTGWAIIPARGGSKGIPGKNLKLIQGRSLIARTVCAAKAAKGVSRVIVSTDSAAIAAEARRAGADVITRPAELSGDEASSESAVLHALTELERDAGLPECVLLMQCTSPFTSAADVDGTLAALASGAADTAHTVTSHHGFLWRQDELGGAVGVNHDKAGRQRRQDRAPEFLETGAVYAMRTPGFRVAKHRFFGKSVLYEVPALRALEIDTPEDLAAARLLAPLVEPQIMAVSLPDPLGAVIFDFDGVMTDDLVHVDENGIEGVTCSRADGLGIARLRAAQVPMAVISKERNRVTAVRCAKLGIECFPACDSKLDTLRAYCARQGIDLRSIVYVGNDLPDVACISAVGFGVAVANARPEVRAAADLTLDQRGGEGAVRELCELVLTSLHLGVTRLRQYAAGQSEYSHAIE